MVLVLADQKTCPCPPSLCAFIILNTYLFFPVTLRLSCLPLACITLTYPSRHPIAARVLAYQHTCLSLFFISLYCRTNHFTLFQSFLFHQNFYSSPLGLVTHFSLSPTLSTFLTSFSQLASLPACSSSCLCCLWSYG